MSNVATVSMICLQMFIEQSKSSKQNYGSASFVPPNAAPQFTFSQWQEGFYVKNASEEFKIKKIESSDGKPKNEDCTITLENAAGESRIVKGATLRKGYEFVSIGDVQLPEPEKTAMPVMHPDCMPFYVNVAGIREFYPRKTNEGTRVLMMDKTAYVVADTVIEVANMVKKAGGYIGSGIVGDVNTNKGG